jgi:hypothetical protein
MKEGGFDIIIGNPPYINIKFLTKIDSGEKTFYQGKFNSATGNYDLYVLFIEKGIFLLKNGGLISFIVPNKFMVTDYGIGIRKLILNTTIINKIIDVSTISVFKNIGIYPIIFVLKKEKDENLRMSNEVKTFKIVDGTFIINDSSYIKIKQKQYSENVNNLFLFGNDTIKNRIIKKIENNGIPLSEVCTINSGTTGFEYTNWGKYISDVETENSVPFIITGNIEKFIINRNKPVKYQGKKLINAYFKKGNDVTEGKWRLFSSKKIVIRGMARNLTAAYDEIGCACGVSVYTITNIDERIDLFYLLGLLNSKLLDFYYKSQFISKHLAGEYIGFNKGQLEQIPIIIADKNYQDKISFLVKDYISKSKMLMNLTGKNTNESDNINLNLIDIKEKIDNLVFEIYNISDSEKEYIANTEIE